MITDARVLKEDFLPKEIVHRHQEINALSNTLEPVLDGQSASPSVLVGPTGAGKTCTAKYTVERLRENVLDLNTQYVNCWENHTKYRALYRLLDGINKTIHVHRQSTPQDELLELLRDHNNKPYVVILDEVDQLDSTDLLYDLYSIPHITPVLITNEADQVFAQMDERVRSRFHAATRIRFARYGVNELTEILHDRAKWGLTKDAVNKRELEYIADQAVGDARVAIAILREAARTAQNQSRGTITKDIVKTAVPNAKTEHKQKTLDKLNNDQRALYNIIESETEIKPGDLYTKYTDQVEDPKTRRTVRNYLSKMMHYELIDATGENRGRTYHINEPITTSN